MSIPDGYRLFRTDIISSGRILFIPSGCRTSEAFQAHLYSSAVFLVLDRTRHQFTSIPHIDFRPAKSDKNTMNRRSYVWRKESRRCVKKRKEQETGTSQT